MKTVKNIVLWLVSVFLLLMAAVLFTESIHGGLLMFAAAMLCNPLVLKLIARGGKKIKPYFSVPAVVVLFFTAILTSPLETQQDKEQTFGQTTDVMETAGQTESDSVLLAEQEEIPEEKRVSSEAENGDAADDWKPEAAELTVHYLDVGQGDCMLLV